jgi:hypothetical protein
VTDLKKNNNNSSTKEDESNKIKTSSLDPENNLPRRY